MKHDKEITQLKSVYRRAKTRCTNPNIKQWLDYGGRGIAFKFKTFEDFFKELGPRPLKYTLERINNDGDYEIGNVKWASRQEQSINKRVYKTNRFNLSGITQLNPNGLYKKIRYLSRTSTNPRVDLYKGPDFFEACCARKSWECVYGK